MRTSFQFCAGLMGCGALAIVLSTSLRALGDATPKPEEQAAQLVQRALQAEANGKLDERVDLLKQVLTVSPDFAPAHWQSGEIRTGDKWTSVDDAAKQDAHSAKLDEYRKLRDGADATVDEQLNLARWCEKAGLKEQQRAHLIFALQLQPHNKEAISKLGLVRFRGQLISAAQLDDIKVQLKQSMAESKEWKARVDGWRQQLQDHPNDPDVLKQIRAVRDPAGIPAMEKGLAQSGQEACMAHLGDTLIRSTRGHPFWVDGKGWQMAKELKAGQWLHTANGAVQIDSIEPSDEAVCYNLVVADFHDYFVSNAKVLVHDNLLRGPTLATVPGLTEAK